jgi:hypothetical protein
MGLFDRLGGQQAQQQITPDMMRQEIGSIKANPGSYLSQHGFNIPNGMTDPRQITQHLLQTGQVGGGMLQQVMRMFGR